MKAAILMPAAGASSRMGGRDKLMEEIVGTPLLSRQVIRAMAAHRPVYVTTRADRPARIAALKALPWKRRFLVPVDDPEEGLAASIRAGVAALPPGKFAALMVLLPDLPDIGTGDILAMFRAFEEAPNRILRATAEDGTPGHPVIFPADMFGQLATLTGDAGAGPILRAHPPRNFALPGRRAVTDLDTPADWAAWRDRNGY